jgi:hypothetical protein
MQQATMHLPILNIEDDKLNFANKSKQIASFISNYPSNVPMSISIDGNWGSGKSTMLNFVEQQIDLEKCKIVRFNPWMITSQEVMIENLFQEILFAIGNDFPELKNRLRQYAQKILPSAVKTLSYITAATNGVDPSTAGVISETSSVVTQEIVGNNSALPLSEIRAKVQKELNEMISNNDQKIVVMIDEIDRLFPTEILSIFQLIKSTLDLPGLFFVVAMDKNAIKDALEALHIRKPEDYLQKIFQKSYVVTSNFQLRTLSKEFLMKHFDTFTDNQTNDFHYLINTFFFLQRDNFIRPNFVLTVNGESPSDRQEELEILYYRLFDVLRKEFENPRQFVKLYSFLTESFPNLHYKLFGEENRLKHELQVMFLTLLSFHRYPEYTDIEMYGNLRYNPNDANIPDLVKLTNHILQLIYTDERKYRTMSGDQVTDADLILKVVLKQLAEHPDFFTI